jgi:hypothetical protein
VYEVEVTKFTHDGARPVGLPARTALRLGHAYEGISLAVGER